MDKKLNTFEALKSCSSDRSVEYHSTCGKYIMHRGREKHGSNVYISDTIGGKQDKILWNQAISTFGVLHIRWKLPEEEKKLHPLEIESGLRLGKHSVKGRNVRFIEIIALIRENESINASYVLTDQEGFRYSYFTSNVNSLKACYLLGDKHEQS